jgi:hypothetical protein
MFPIVFELNHVYVLPIFELDSLTPLLRVLEVRKSNLVLKTSFLTQVFRSVNQSLESNAGSALNYTKAISFLILSNSSLTYLLIIRRYIAGVVNLISFGSRTLGGNSR